MTNKQQFFDFLNDYIKFYEQMELQSKNRLEVIASYNLPGLEKAIANDESAIMRAEQMEKRRIELQVTAGFSNLPLREIIEQLENDDKVTLQTVYNRLSELLESIQFYNERSAVMVESNLYRMEKAASTPPPQTISPAEHVGGLDTKA